MSRWWHGNWERGTVICWCFGFGLGKVVVWPILHAKGWL